MNRAYQHILQLNILSIWRNRCNHSFKRSFSSILESVDSIPSNTRNDTSNTSALPPASTTDRLSKFIASSGICSRREAEILIKNGRIQINGVVCTNVSELIDLSIHPKPLVMVDGVKIQKNKSIVPPKLWAVYKFHGELTSDNDPKGRKLLLTRVGQLLKNTPMGGPEKTSHLSRESLKPVNRLDYTTEGLCLVTNNGVLARLLGSSDTMKKQYRVRVHGLLNESKLEGLRRGVYMDGKRQKPMEVSIEKSSATISWIRVTTTESSNRTVYNCLRQLHLDVTRMISVGLGPYDMLSVLSKGTIAEVKLTPEIMKEYLTLQKK